ncbi:RNA polymerase sigma-70 factor, ECF subfamily [Paenibacillus sp. UNCCL117]|uniref:sigma-70 family RNA polymerase sigma factor n=1 Tax=unclassified Paenibacillus TaxID=185978 RepID=UPI000880E48A|nr:MULTISPECIES: sigma-70 family RNA polymerase sigma factor [unclassified Paenibacillus]SDE38746.1 RNA polymerase sigma-70 factor, ECF subfamily [Paenibacillus sp. cl123]SFW65140.1 RNA polymerase sigma-70 factor, ECF subfamily [Paenibacillus sp. UNCCL117]
MSDMSTVDSYRPLLMTLAYRMLGSLSEAEDIVQDALADYAITADHASIKHEKAYLVRMVTNRSLNLKQSARKRRELYVGQWLPEPAIAVDGVGCASGALGSATGKSGNPADYIERQENITYVMLVMLERLTAVERAVFLLRETLDFDYGEIADIVQKSEANCRKIFSRAKEKLQGSAVEGGGAEVIDPMRLNEEQAYAFAKAFMQAAETGNSSALVDMLAHDAVLVTDGGGKARAAINPIEGSERIAAFFMGNARKGTMGDSFLPVDVSGQPGLIVTQNGQPARIMVFGWDAEKRISRIFIIMNPDKLAGVTDRFAALS